MSLIMFCNATFYMKSSHLAHSHRCALIVWRLRQGRCKYHLRDLSRGYRYSLIDSLSILSGIISVCSRLFHVCHLFHLPVWRLRWLRNGCEFFFKFLVPNEDALECLFQNRWQRVLTLLIALPAPLGIRRLRRWLRIWRIRRRIRRIWQRVSTIFGSSLTRQYHRRHRIPFHKQYTNVSSQY